MLAWGGKTKTAKVGTIAARLVSCIEAIHERKHVFVDIKPENFMLAAAAGDGSEGQDDIRPEKIAKRIRILDPNSWLNS